MLNAFSPEKALLSRTKGAGLQIDYWFTRQPPSAALPEVSVLGLRLHNRRPDQALTNIRVLDAPAQLVAGGFEPVLALGAGMSCEARLLCAFAGKWRAPVRFTVATGEGDKFPVELRASVGELLAPCMLDAAEFERQRVLLGGLHEAKVATALPSLAALSRVANLGAPVLRAPPLLGFAARRVDGASRSLLLVTVREPGGVVCVHCADAVAGMALAEDIKLACAQWSE